MENDDQLLDIKPRPDYEPQITVRTKIVEILTKVETRQAYSDKLLDKELKEFNDPDRRLITEVVNGVLRWRLRLDWYLNQLYLGEYENLITDVKNNLRSSVYQLVYLEKVPPYAVLFEAVEIAKAKYNQKTANLVNAILRNFLRQQKKFEIMETQLDVLDRVAHKFSHPKWLVQRWIEYWGIDEVHQLCEVNNQPPRLSVRLNKLKTDEDEFFKVLDSNGIEYELHPDFQNFIWIDNFQKFRNLEFLTNGWVSVQDISTGLPVLALDPKPGEKILDMCAAPGGKSGYIAEIMQNEGIILAFDRHLSRVRLTRENMQRFGYQNVYLSTADSNMLPTNLCFDKVLLDVPCSGFGVLSKRVDLKWKRTEQDIINMKGVQSGLLEAAAQAVKDKGIIVYCTCTVEPEENEKVIDNFLRRHPDFTLDNLEELIPQSYMHDKFFVKTFPHKHKMDGSFVARLKKLG